MVAMPMPPPTQSVARPAQVAPLELVDQGAEDHRAGRAERVAHRDRAAVDVGDLVGDAHVVHEAHRDRRRTPR